MIKEQKIAFLLVGIFFLTTVSFAQSEEPISENPKSGDESTIEAMMKEKERALEAGNKNKAAAIDRMVQDFKSGKITAQELLDPNPQLANPKSGESSNKGDMSKGGSTNQGQKGSSNMQGGSQQGAPQGSGGYSQQKGQPSGMSSPPSGDMSKGSSMMQQGMQGGPMNQGQKGSSNMQGGSQQGAPQGSGGYSSEQEKSSYEGGIKTEKQANTKTDYEKEGVLTKEKVLKKLQKLKEKAIAAGNMEEAKKLHAEIENIRAGKSDFTKSSGGDGPTQTKEGLDKQDDNP